MWKLSWSEVWKKLLIKNAKANSHKRFLNGTTKSLLLFHMCDFTHSVEKLSSSSTRHLKKNEGVDRKVERLYVAKPFRKKTFYNDILIKAKNFMKHFYEFFVCSWGKFCGDFCLMYTFCRIYLSPNWNHFCNFILFAF